MKGICYENRFSCFPVKHCYMARYSPDVQTLQNNRLPIVDRRRNAQSSRGGVELGIKLRMPYTPGEQIQSKQTLKFSAGGQVDQTFSAAIITA